MFEFKYGFIIFKFIWWLMSPTNVSISRRVQNSFATKHLNSQVKSNACNDCDWYIKPTTMLFKDLKVIPINFELKCWLYYRQIKYNGQWLIKCNANKIRGWPEKFPTSTWR